MRGIVLLARRTVAAIGVLAALAVGGGPARATPIAVEPITVNMFRDTRSVNDVGIGEGDQFQYGADIVGGSAGSSLGAGYPVDCFTNPPTCTFVDPPVVCAPLAVNQEFCGQTTPFSQTRIQQPWSFRFTNGPDTLIVAGPTLTDNNGAIADDVAFPVDVTITAGATARTPTIKWTMPGDFVPDAFRVNIFSKGRRLDNGQADVIHSVAIPATATSYTIPPDLNNTLGLSLEIGGPYVINFQLIETRGHVPLAGNNNALILRRSSSFFEFSPTDKPGPPDVHLPQVGLDPDPTDDLGAPYRFKATVVGPDHVTFIDPEVAVGYNYAIGAGDPNFASVLLPDVGDGKYQVIVGGVAHPVQAGEQFFFPPGGVSAFSVRGIEVLVGLDPGNVTAFVTGLTFVSEGSFTGTMTPVLANVPDERQLTALGPANVWMGLKNSDAVGLRLDVRAEVFLGATEKVGEGQLDNVLAGSSGFNNARLHAIPLSLTSGVVTLAPNAELRVAVSARRTCSGGGHSTGTPRLWLDGALADTGPGRDAGSRLNATIDGAETAFFLRRESALSLAEGASRTSIAKPVGSTVPCSSPNGRPFTPFGTWSIRLPLP